MNILVHFGSYNDLTTIADDGCSVDRITDEFTTTTLGFVVRDSHRFGEREQLHRAELCSFADNSRLGRWVVVHVAWPGGGGACSAIETTQPARRRALDCHSRADPPTD